MYDPLKGIDIHKENPIILGIESSCDETAAAVLRGREILSNEIYSSASVQALYGGVVPEIASRAHTDAVEKVVQAAVENAGISLNDIDAVAVTYGAGLLGALLVGVSFAKAFAYALNKPLIAVNHIRGHLSASYLQDETLKPPFVTLLASGGHTAVLYTKTETEFELLGGTLDDAVGEAFDKVARVLGLQYPGGPNIERLAKTGKNSVPMPKMLKGAGGYNFSYSGLKTAVINYCHTKQQKNEEYEKADVACSFQTSAIDVLVEKTIAGAKEKGVDTIVVGHPINMNGTLGPRSERVQAFAGILRELTDLPVILHDERLSTAQAHQMLNLTGSYGKKRREVIDEMSACLILQNYMDQQKNKQNG